MGKSEELRELIGLEPVSLMIKKSRLRWLDMLSEKMIMTWSNGVWRGKLKELDREDARKKTWWDCVKNDMQSLGPSQKDVQSRNK